MFVYFQIQIFIASPHQIERGAHHFRKIELIFHLCVITSGEQHPKRVKTQQDLPVLYMPEENSGKLQNGVWKSRGSSQHGVPSERK